MIYPTIRTLERLLDFADVSAVLGACALSEEPLWTSCPRTGLLGGREARYMEHEAAFGELALVCPDGPRSGEVLFALAMARGGRVHSRMGVLEIDQVKGEDGLR